MAKIVVTSTANYIHAVFNDYASAVNMSYATWPKSSIDRMEMNTSGDGITVHMKDNTQWTVDWDAANYFKVDSVDAVPPTSNADLYTKIQALITP